jgi:ATP-dependent Zn protease
LPHIIGNEASIIATRLDQTSVKMINFDQAIERVIAGLAKTKNTITPRERKILAHHEAGHAVVAYFVEHSDPLVKVSIVPRAGLSENGGQTLGFSQHVCLLG